jgi:hypothetical protein
MNPLVPADTRVQIADGEIERLRVCLSKANEQAEHFEREWYLRGDEIEQLRTELAVSREREARMRGALRNLLALDVDHQRGADDEDVCAEVREARAALAEGAQG